MRMQAIDEGCIGDASALLSRGFPERAPAFWDAALARLLAYRKAAGVGPIGQMLVVGKAPVGVILTIGSQRTSEAAPRDIINLSSWYVEEKHRWLAPRMLQRVVADESAVYTDLSPSRETQKVNAWLGFRVASEGVFLFLLPWVAIARRRTAARVVPLAQAGEGVLSRAEREMLMQHERLGRCIAAVLCVEGQHHPLLFYTTRRKGLPVARLLLAEGRRLVADHLPAIARFLLRRGILCLTVHADRSERMPGGILWRRFAPVQVKGDWPRARVDHAFSELVLLRL